MSFDELLKIIHIAFAMVWVGGTVGIIIHAMRAMSSATGEGAQLQFLRQSRVMGRVFMVSGIVVALVGTWLVIRIDAWGFDQFWISFAYAVVIASALLGMFFYTPNNRKMIAMAEGGDTTSDAFRKLGRTVGQVAMLEAAFLIAVIWAMVVKPGA